MHGEEASDGVRGDVLVIVLWDWMDGVDLIYFGCDS
jgi:hypothetical protein